MLIWSRSYPIRFDFESSDQSAINTKTFLSFFFSLINFKFINQEVNCSFFMLLLHFFHCFWLLKKSSVKPMNHMPWLIPEERIKRVIYLCRCIPSVLKNKNIRLRSGIDGPRSGQKNGKTLGSLKRRLSERSNDPRLGKRFRNSLKEFLFSLHDGWFSISLKSADFQRCSLIGCEFESIWKPAYENKYISIETVFIYPEVKVRSDVNAGRIQNLNFGI